MTFEGVEKNAQTYCKSWRGFVVDCGGLPGIGSRDYPSKPTVKSQSTSCGTTDYYSWTTRP